jgi:hypothetical protein
MISASRVLVVLRLTFRRYWMARRATWGLVSIAALLLNVSCRGVLGPSCTDESAEVFRAGGAVRPGETRSYTVVSPTSSNLVMRLTWTDASTTLAMSATITDCGIHAGCVMTTVTPPPGPGGSSPVPLPWPPGVREMLVDGSRGKAWRIDITGDAATDASFTLVVTYRITCES